MPNKKAARNKNSAEKIADSDLPNWRSKLISVPEAERCRSQRDLARSLDLIDLQLSLFKGTQPPANFNGKDTTKAVLAAFEVDFLRFHLNTALPLYPASRYPDILPWLSQNQDYDWNLLQRLQEIHSDSRLGEAGLEEILGSTVKMLFLHYHSCGFANSSSPYNFDSFAKFWSGWQRRWDELEEAGADEVLTGLGSKLTINHLRLLSQGVVVCMRAFDARQKRDPDAAIEAWYRLVQFAPTALVGPTLKPFCSFWWYFTIKAMNILETEIGAVTFDDRWRIPRHSERWLRLNAFAQLAMQIIRIKMAPEILEAAEAEQPRDDALRAYALFNLAEVKALGIEPWRYEQVEELLEQGEEALKGCKAWFPSLFRKLLKSQIADAAEGYLTAVRRKHPRDFRTITLGRKDSREATAEVTSASAAKTEAAAQMHTCDFCGSQGRDMSLCAGCQKVRYCGRKCQKAGWKGGHKEKCST